MPKWCLLVPIDHNAAAKDAEATKYPSGENATELRIYSSCSNRLARILEHPELELSNTWLRR